MIAVERDVISDTSTTAEPSPVDDADRDGQSSFDMFDLEDIWRASTSDGVPRRRSSGG